MNVIEILTDYLKENKFDGLFNNDFECGCEVGDLVPCQGNILDCEAGWKVPCHCEENHDWHITNAEEGPEDAT